MFVSNMFRFRGNYTANLSSNNPLIQITPKKIPITKLQLSVQCIEVKEYKQDIHRNTKTNNVYFTPALFNFCILWYIMANKCDLRNVLYLINYL